MGLNFTGSYQTEDTTLKRISGGECYVALINKQIVGTVLLYTGKLEWATGWYDREGIAIVGQFAVELKLQNNGVGGLLMDHVEQRAADLGLSEVSASTPRNRQHISSITMQSEVIAFSNFNGGKAKPIEVS
jgi:GNAT superfamily N-acetyltransferase